MEILLTKAWFRIKWLDEFKMFFVTIETNHSEARYSITKSQADQIIKALQQEQDELLFEVS